jgi:hypothetical protein
MVSVHELSSVLKQISENYTIMQQQLRKAHLKKIGPKLAAKEQL